MAPVLKRDDVSANQWAMMLHNKYRGAMEHVGLLRPWHWPEAGQLAQQFDVMQMYGAEPSGVDSGTAGSGESSANPENAEGPAQ